MGEHGLHVVSGGLGYSGKHIVRRLLERGLPTRTPPWSISAARLCWSES